jgi:hypothetical protein
MFSRKVPCEDCRHIVKKEDASKVLVTIWQGKKYEETFYLYYCPEHRKPYEEIRNECSFGVGVAYISTFEVSPNGVPYGYKPIPNK